jgi:hypothetical protein
VSMGFTQLFKAGRAEAFSEALIARKLSGDASFSAAEFAAAIDRRGKGIGLDPSLGGEARSASIAGAAASPQMGLMTAMLGDAAPLFGNLSGRPPEDLQELKAAMAEQSREIAALREAVGSLSKAPRRKPVK